MKITLKRYRTSRWGTDGHLLIDGEVFCDTIEHPKRLLAAGEYRMEAGYCTKMEQPTFYLNRLNRQGKTIYRKPTTHICIGNGPCKLENGSIIVGVKYLPGVVLMSRIMFECLMKRLKWERELTLTIV